MIKRKSVVFVLAISAASCVFAAPQLDDDLRAALQARVDTGELASVVVGIIDSGESAIHTFGKPGAVPTGQTVYEIGSVSKTFTGLLLAQAARSGAVRLEQPVAELLPGYRVPDFAGKHITLLDLATQSSGLPRLPNNMRPARMDNPYAGYRAAELQAFLAAHKLAREPGKSYEYSNLGFGLLGFALARHAGTSYDELVRTRIAAPLGMESTAVVLTPSMRARLATGHDAEGRPVANWDMDTMAGAGAIRSNAHDMVRYVQAMMTAAADSPYALARQPVRPAAGKDVRIGLGWHVNAVRGTPVVWHNGMTGGYASFAGFTADGKRGVVVLTNSAVAVDSVALAVLAPGAAPEPKQVALPADVMAAYTGRYQLAPDFVLRVRPAANGGLMTQATGQGWIPAFATARDEFFVRGAGARLSFQRDASGAVHSVVLHQHGRKMPAPKLAAAKRTTVQLDAATMEQYRGTYMLDIGLALEVTLEGGQLYGQAAGQERFPLLAAAKDELFYEDDGIEVAFRRNASGAVDHLVLRQNGGQALRGARQK
ncbi:serine hydrolase [Pseudoduganella sp. GCM10020061]|uniref:serine hydrolase n=1 Tax=Pseudoduganella sp. GCM10020061 TaxID=3317345 RepID=UPI0036322EB8